MLYTKRNLSLPNFRLLQREGFENLVVPLVGNRWPRGPTITDSVKAEF